MTVSVKRLLNLLAITAFSICHLSVIPAFAEFECTIPTKIFFTPYDDGLAPYLALLDRAQNSVYIAIYGFTEPAITNKLIELHNRGVQIHIVMDRSQSRGKNQSLQTMELQDAGIDLVIGTSAFHGQIMHDKFTVVDDRYVEVGSWNYTTSATKQDNVLIFADSPGLASRFMSYWNHIHEDILSQISAHY